MGFMGLLDESTASYLCLCLGLNHTHSKYLATTPLGGEYI